MRRPSGSLGVCDHRQKNLEGVILAGNVDAQSKFGYAGGETIGHNIPILIPPGLRGEDMQGRQEKRALPENEELFRRIANTAPVMIWMSGIDKLCTYFNQPWLQFTGRSLDSELGNGWAEGVHSEDLGRCLDTYTKAFDLREPFSMEYRLRRHDGEYRWILDSGVPIFNPDSSFAGYIGSAMDITERKLAEESLSKLSQGLIEAQEEERAAVDRELHHYIDSLVVLSINLDLFQQNPPELETEIRQQIGSAREQVKDIVRDIRALSHLLHSKLEYLGLAGASASFCKEFSDKQNVKIDFHYQGVPNELTKEVAVCLYRVLQEALQNATKYSRSRLFEVSLRAEPNEIQLTVRGWGRGFDPAVALEAQALGITAMRERLKLVDGDLSIESQPKRGITIHARVPRYRSKGLPQRD
jgi:PAS domain S-box-containing protein